MNMFKALGLTAALSVPALVNADDAPPPIPATPAPIIEIVEARPFALEQVTTHFWHSERPSYKTGYLLVLKVNPDLVIPRAVAEPLLFIGDQTAERVNHGAESGYVIAIVPGNTVDPKHRDFIDLSKDLIWFGEPDLPELVTRNTARAQLELARRAGIQPLGPQAVETARTRAGATEAITAETKQGLIEEAVTLIRRYSPQEEDLAKALSINE